MEQAVDLPTYTAPPLPPPPPPLPKDLQLQSKGFKTQKENFEPVRLHFAINDGNISEVTHWIDRGLNINYCIHGNTPLTLAILKEHVDIAHKLIDSGANVTIPEKAKWQRQPIHLACRYGNEGLVQSLVNHGASVHAVDAMFFTPLHWASNWGNKKIVRFLLAAGAHINVKDDLGRTPLHRASENNHMDIVKLLCAEYANVKARDSFGWTPLFQCIVCNYLEMALELLALGADPNHRDNLGETPLHKAAGRTRRENLLVLSKINTEFYLRNYEGGSPAVYHAFETVSDDCSLTTLLLDAGADPSALNGKGRSALWIAASEGNVMLCRWLVGGGALLSSERWIHAQDWPFYLQRHEETQQWLTYQAAVVVRSLADSCKFTIRRSLAPCISSKIPTLALPAALLQFLEIEINS